MRVAAARAATRVAAAAFLSSDRIMRGADWVFAGF